MAVVESAAITASQIFQQAQQMALVNGGVVGAGTVGGLGAQAGMSGAGGYGGGMGAGRARAPAVGLLEGSLRC